MKASKGVTSLFLSIFGHQIRRSSGYLLLGNGEFYTMEDSNPIVEAIAVNGSSIVGLGTVDSLRQSLGRESGFWDLNGRLVLPGFQDVHVHAVEAGINSGICYIAEDMDLYDIARTLRRCKNGGKFGDQGWIVGVGIDTTILMEQVWELDYDWPIDVLDYEFPDTPVLILDNLGHSAVANTAAFENSDMFLYYDEDPRGGIIDRDIWNGTLYVTGVVRENAQQGFRNAAFPPTDKNKQIAYNSLLKSMSTLASYGITSVSDAGGFWKQAQTEAWERAEVEGKMLVRASNTFYVYPDLGISEQTFFLLSKFSNEKHRLVRFNQAKIYVDGILSLATSALNEPYEDSLELSTDEALGFEYFESQAILQTIANQLVQGGYQLNFHVTGDRGATIALDTISNLPNSTTSGPHRLTHCYLLDEVDRTRFEELNVVADFQLSPSSLDPSYRSSISDVIGSTRASELLPVREVLDTGAVVTLSSDWDADELDPLVKLKVALTLPSGKAVPDLHTAIKMMTLNPATAMQQQESTGSLQVGKFADFVVLSRNIFDLDPEDIDEAEVLVTVMNGKRTYDPNGLYGERLGKRPGASLAPVTRVISLSLGVAASVTAMALSDILF